MTLINPTQSDHTCNLCGGPVVDFSGRPIGGGATRCARCASKLSASGVIPGTRGRPGKRVNNGRKKRADGPQRGDRQAAVLEALRGAGPSRVRELAALTGSSVECTRDALQRLRVHGLAVGDGGLPQVWVATPEPRPMPAVLQRLVEAVGMDPESFVEVRQ